LDTTRTTEYRDTTIADIHRIREEIWEKFGGDIGAIIRDAQRRQEESGCEIIKLEDSLKRNSDGGVGR
jgi:hypothetical protein